MEILSIKHKISKSIGNSNIDEIPFCVVTKKNSIIEKYTFMLVYQYNDCIPFYISREITNSEYNSYDYLKDCYLNYETDFLKESKEEDTWANEECNRIIPVILKFMESKN
jgi:hypothetical protein